MPPKLALWVAFAGFLTAVPQQTTPAAIVSGRVVQLGSNDALQGAMVTLSQQDVPPGTTNPTRIQETNDRGEFSFTNLQSGRYELKAEKHSFLPVIHGQARPGSGGPGVALVVVAGQRIDSIVLPLPRAAAIAGVALNSRGEPALARVRLWRFDFVAGERTLRAWNDRISDDRGAYRFWDLRPGAYFLSAEPISSDGNALDPIPAPVFYPDTVNALDALAVTVGFGEERLGVDLRVRTVHLGSISGTYGVGDGRQVTWVGIAIADQSGTPILRPQYTLSNSAKAYSFQNLVPGNYRVMMTTRVTPSGPDPGFWAMADVAVGTAAVNVTL